MYGLQKAVSSLVSGVYVRPQHVPCLPASAVDRLESLLEPGDILVTRKEHAMTNYFLPGFWPHAALFVGDAECISARGLHKHPHVVPHWDELPGLDEVQPRRVVESMKDGVRLRSLAVTLECDAITIIRPKLTASGFDEAVGRAFFHVGNPYDFDFDFSRSDRMVCSEVVYRAFDSVGGIEFDLMKRAGRLTLAPEDIMRMALAGRSFEILACYVKSGGNELMFGDEAASLVSGTVAVV